MPKGNQPRSQNANKAIAKQRQPRKQRKLRRLIKQRKPANMAQFFTKRGQTQLRVAQGALGRLASAITLPSESKPWRYPTTSLDTQKTALWDLTNELAVDYSTTPIGSQVLMLTHSPISPVWGTATSTSTRFYAWGPMAPVNTGNATIDMAFASVLDANPVKCYPADDSKSIWCYCPAGLIPVFRLAVWAAAGTIRVIGRTRVLWGVEAPYDLTVTVNATGDGSVSLSAQAYARWFTVDTIIMSGSSLTGSNSRVTIEIPAGTAFWPIMEMPAIRDLSSPMEKMRVNSAALLMMNTSAPLYKNGRVNAAKLSWSSVNVFTPSLCIAEIGKVHKDLKFFAPAETGAYTYLVPTEASLNFSDYIATGTGVEFTYDFGDFKDVNFVSFSVAATAVQQFTLELRYDAHLEAITSSQIYNLGVPVVLPNEFQQIISAASTLVPFTENPLHPILRALAVRVIKQMAPRVARGAHQLIDMASNAASRL